MEGERLKTLKTGRKIGALIGAILFVAFGIVPAFYFGSYATLVLMTHLVGEPLEPGMLVRVLVVIGIIFGLFCTAAVSIVVGSLSGTVLAYITDIVSETVKVIKSRVKEAESTVSQE
jgi:hypothetical protein